MKTEESIKMLATIHDVDIITELTHAFIREQFEFHVVSIWLRIDEDVFSLKISNMTDNNNLSNEQSLSSIAWKNQWMIPENTSHVYASPATYLRMLKNKNIILESTQVCIDIPMRLPPYLLGFVRLELASHSDIDNFDMTHIENTVQTCANSIYSTFRFQQVNLHRKAEHIAVVRELREKKDALEVCVDAFVSIDFNNKIIRFFENAEQLFGYRTNEILGQHIRTVCPSLAKALKSRNPSEDQMIYHEVGCLKNDGAGFIALVAAIPAREGYGINEIIGTTLMFRDISESVRNRKHIEKLEETVKRDPLTGAYNRSYASEWLKTRMSELQDEDKPITIAMVDIDNFKNLNDTYGHQFGDTVLINVTNQMKNCLRSVDLLARYGGEEFIIGLQACNESEAEIVLNKIRQKISAQIHERASELVNVTVSIGFEVCFDVNVIDEVIRRADIALYKAKNTGRNRVVFAGDNQLDMFAVEIENDI